MVNELTPGDYTSALAALEILSSALATMQSPAPGGGSASLLDLYSHRLDAIRRHVTSHRTWVERATAARPSTAKIIAPACGASVDHIYMEIQPCANPGCSFCRVDGEVKAYHQIVLAHLEIPGWD